jgi:hypothetical protein
MPFGVMGSMLPACLVHPNKPNPKKLEDNCECQIGGVELRITQAASERCRPQR